MELVVHPRETTDFESFQRNAAPAVALDGYVTGPTRVRAPHHGTFDHHADCDRWTTRATCEQVALALRARCPLLVDEDGRPRKGLAVHVNDADPDVAISVWLINHPGAVSDAKVNHLVTIEGAVDTVGGGLNVAPEELDELGWVIDPWAAVRDRMATADADGMAAIIDEVGHRIDAWLEGRGGRVCPTDQVEVLSRHGDVWVIVEHHPFARLRASAGGARGYVAVRPGPDGGTAAMTVGVCDMYAGADLEQLWVDLNRLEGTDDTPHDSWGGSTIVGGSPRQRGTTLDAGDIADRLNSLLKAS